MISIKKEMINHKGMNVEGLLILIYRKLKDLDSSNLIHKDIQAVKNNLQ